MELKFEDLVYEAAKDALKETIIKEINKKKPEIKVILNELFTKESIIETVQDILKYDEILQDNLREIVMQVFDKKIDEIFVNIK